MSEFTPNGIQIDRYPEIVEKLGDDLKSRFGDDTLVDSPEAIIGNLVFVISSALDGQNGMIQGIVDSFNPAAATGVFLSNLVALNGLVRKEAVYSVVSLDCTAGTAATVIPAGSIVTNPDETVEFVTDADLPLGAGVTDSVSATCSEPGAIFADVGTLTKIKTPVYSWESVTNPLSSTVGATEESDAALRARRDAAATVTGSASGPAILRNIEAIPSVESAQVHINDTDAVDSYGNPPQSVWAIVKGATDQELAEVLAETVAGGIIFIGAETEIYTDPANGKEYEVKFSRPDEIPTQIQMTIRANSLFPDDGVSQIKEQIVDYYAGDFTIDGRKVRGFGVGDNVVYSRIFSPINSVPGHEILSLEIRRTGDSWGVVTLPMEVYEQGVINETDITVNVIV